MPKGKQSSRPLACGLLTWGAFAIVKQTPCVRLRTGRPSPLLLWPAFRRCFSARLPEHYSRLLREQVVRERWSPGAMLFCLGGPVRSNFRRRRSSLAPCDNSATFRRRAVNKMRAERSSRSFLALQVGFEPETVWLTAEPVVAATCHAARGRPHPSLGLPALHLRVSARHSPFLLALRALSLGGCKSMRNW